MEEDFFFSFINFFFLAAFLRMVDGDFFLISLVLDLEGSWSMVVKLKANPLGSLRSNLKDVPMLIKCLVKSKHWANTKVFSMLLS